jgi:uncharacterized protein
VPRRVEKDTPNVVERVLGSTVAQASALLTELRPLVVSSLSRRVHRHYRGFALNQLRFAEKEPTVKKLLYVLRTSLTGIHLLETGALEADLTRLVEPYGLADATLLVERKRAGERVGIDPDLLAWWRPRIDALFARLDAAVERSPLPAAPPNEGELREWLLSVRRSRMK